MLPLTGAGPAEEDGLGMMMDVVSSGGGAGAAIGGAGAEAVRSTQLHQWYEAFRPWTIKYVGCVCNVDG